jgi:hypothetical protein
MEYKTLNINQKINAKNNEVVEWSRSITGKLMHLVKRGRIFSTGSRMKLEPDGINDNRNYDGPGDDYYSGYYGGDWGSYVEDHRMIEAQKLK